MKIGIKKSTVILIVFLLVLVGGLTVLFFFFKDKLFNSNENIKEEEISYFPEDHAPFFPEGGEYNSCYENEICYVNERIQPFVKRYFSENGLNFVEVEYSEDKSGEVVSKTFFLTGDLNTLISDVEVNIDYYNPEYIIVSEFILAKDKTKIGGSYSSQLMSFEHFQEQFPVGSQLNLVYIKDLPDINDEVTFFTKHETNDIYMKRFFRVKIARYINSLSEEEKIYFILLVEEDLII